MKKDGFYEKVRSYIDQYDLIPEGYTVIAGVSGGADSTALLDILSRLSRERQFKLHVLHVNHGIRAEEAVRDQEFVRNLCIDRHIPFHLVCEDVPGMARQMHMGLEEAGRILRRRAFYNLKEDLLSEGPGLFALAHHRDDQAETILHNLFRGSGIKGMTGLRPRHGDMIRPFLSVRRWEIEVYLNDRGLAYVTDSTNLDTLYTRNYLRHKVVPIIEKEINPRVVDHISYAGVILNKADTYLSQVSKDHLGRYVKLPLDTDRIFLPDAFMGEAEILREYMLHEILSYLAGGAKDIYAVHISGLEDLFRKKEGKLLDLPSDLQAVKTHGGVNIAKKKNKTDSKDQYLSSCVISWKGEEHISTPWGLVSFRILSSETIYEINRQKKYTKCFDYDKICNGLSEDGLQLRTRRGGDYICYDDHNNRKKLTRCMIDDKLCRDKRDTIPLLAIGQEVLWIVGERVSPRYKYDAAARILEVSFQSGGEDE